jgi:polyisoprenyl-phosphate glycosyltransferase
MTIDAEIELSVVVPVFNEAANVGELVGRLIAALEGTGEPFELVLVDDGSADLTLHRLRELALGEPRLCVLSLSRNYGQEAAVQAGILAARGRWIVQLDADLQHPPEEIGKLLAARAPGVELVYGVRERRDDPAHRVISSRLMMWTMRRVFGIELPRDISTFRVIDARLARYIAELPEKRKFFSALACYCGARSVDVVVAHAARQRGKSGYGLARLLNHSFDLLVGFSVRPLRIIGATGAIFALLGIGFGLFRIGLKLAGVPINVGYTSLIAAIVISGGLQLIALSVIGEYVARIFLQAQDRPVFRVAERIGPGAASAMPASGLRAAPLTSAELRARVPLAVATSPARS